MSLMLKIRLQRVGRKHEPTFRVVLTDSQNSTKSGKMLEILGSHDPRHKEKTELKADKIKYWISKGAKPTDTLHNMLVSKKIIEGKKINVLPRKTPIKKDAPAAEGTTPAPTEPATPAPVPETPVEAPPAEPTPEPAQS